MLEYTCVIQAILISLSLEIIDTLTEIISVYYMMFFNFIKSHELQNLVNIEFSIYEVIKVKWKCEIDIASQKKQNKQ